MPGARISSEQLNEILSKKGYGISGVGGGIGASKITSKISGAGKIDDVEHDIGDASLQAKKLQVNYSGKPEIRITFYRHRLADHSRAISEKALIDGLQYAGIIEGDSQEEIRLTYVEQEKIGSDEEERTTIDIIYDEVDLDNLWKKGKEHKGR